MKEGTTADVRRACDALLAQLSTFYQVPECGIRVLAARPLRVRETWSSELFGDYTRHDADSRLDADRGAQGCHFVRNVPEHVVPRVLPSSRF